jgi:hypothetical protein
MGKWGNFGEIIHKWTITWIENDCPKHTKDCPKMEHCPKTAPKIKLYKKYDI